jgi:hypothetical protein
LGVAGRWSGGEERESEHGKEMAWGRVDEATIIINKRARPFSASRALSKLSLE